MTTFPEVFTALKGILLPYAEKLVCIVDQADEFSLETRYIQINKQPLWFGAVRLRKNYVSYYLMPVYIQPALLENLTPALKKRMQGKSCFNFTTHDALLFQELTTLTEAAFQFYERQGYLHPANP